MRAEDFEIRADMLLAGREHVTREDLIEAMKLAFDEGYAVGDGEGYSRGNADGWNEAVATQEE